MRVLEFLAILRKELEKVVPSELLVRGRLSDSMFGEFLGKSRNHINYIKSQVKKYELKGEIYLLALDLFNDYKLNLESKLGEKAKKATEIIEMYKDSNFLKKSSKRVHSHHPNLILDYFKIIDTKEKAYWLGFLFADGFIE